MLSAEANRQLVETGPGTLMGELMRRYWVPALLASEVAEPDGPPVRVKLMGEELICFRDSLDRLGMLEEHCAHRGVSLWFGLNEACGLRCPYHGWKYDVTGQLVDLPSEPEDSVLRRRIRLKSYPTLERAGVIWTYLGPPELQPPPPALEWVDVPDDARFISKRLQECNYLQAMEGGIDSSHVTFLHGAQLRTDPLFVGARGNDYNDGDRMPVFEIEEFDGGLLIGARRKAQGENWYWRITPWIMPWYTIIPPRGQHPLGAHAWVPIDDENCWAWSIDYHPSRALSAKEVQAMQDGHGIHVRYERGGFVPVANRRNDYLIDRAAQKAGRTMSGVNGIGVQDAAVQESMGAIQDRTREHLCSTDLGIIATRRMLLEAAEAVRRGAPAPATLPAHQRVRAAACELPKSVKFRDGAKSGLFAPLGTEPVSV